MRAIKYVLLTLVTAIVLALPATAAARDRNHDRIPDRWEKRHHLSLKVKQTRKDQDRDGLRNLGEFRSRTDPRDADSDDDGVEDADEDRDHDGVDNGNEEREGTDPDDRDSDDDGRSDGREDEDRDELRNVAEDRTGNDPIDKDTDDDGVKDGDEHAGKVASFTNGVLEITLADGSTVKGKVTDATKISCETEDEHEGDNDQDEHGDDDDSHSARASDEGSDGDHEDGDDDGDHEGNGDDDNVCSPSDLVQNVVVHEAELELTASGAVFEEIEIVK